MRKSIVSAVNIVVVNKWGVNLEINNNTFD